MTEELLSALAGSALERLKWRVRRALCVPPGHEAPDARWIECAAHMVLDLRGASGGGNPGFDMERFRELKGRIHD